MPVHTLEIVLPLPPRELSPNARGHFYARARAVKRYRQAAHLLALEALRSAFRGRPPTAKRMRFVFAWPDHRRRDIDNALAAMKPAIDGLVDAGVVPDDSAMAVREIVATSAVCRDRPGVHVAIDFSVD